MHLPFNMTRVLTFVLSVLILGAFGQAPVDHKLAAGDSVVVKVYGEPELDTTAPVSRDGRISVPMAGEVAVGGMTAAEAAKTIADAYRERRFLKNPSVTVTLGSITRQRFSVTGQVLKPGPYFFPPGPQPLTVMQAIGIAGGHTRIASLSKVTIQRGAQIIKVDAKKLTKNGGVSPNLQPGDIVNVPEGW